MKFLVRFLLGFLVISLAVGLITSFLGVELAHAQYWSHHGILFLFFITVFPRLTLLLATASSGGLLWWLGWFFSPHLLVAVLATLNYWNENPFLVVLAWLVALGGETSEKYVTIRRSRTFWAGREERRRGYDEAKWVDSSVKDKD